LSKKEASVFYHFYPSTEEAELNLAIFLERAVADVGREYFVNLVEAPSFSVPEYPHIKYLQYENCDADFGGLSRFLEEFGAEVLGNNLFVANSSVAGPFVPPNYRFDWLEIFGNRMSDKTGIVGSSLSFLTPSSPHAEHYFLKYGGERRILPHVQTFAYLLSSSCLNFLLSSDFFFQRFDSDRMEIISGYELRMSQILMQEGWGIDSITHPGPGIFANTLPPDHFQATGGDYMMPNAYFGDTLHPYESVFIKTRRFNKETGHVLLSLSERGRNLQMA